MPHDTTRDAPSGGAFRFRDGRAMTFTRVCGSPGTARRGRHGVEATTSTASTTRRCGMSACCPPRRSVPAEDDRERPSRRHCRGNRRRSGPRQGRPWTECFLLRPELRDLWTLSVYLKVSPEESLRRAHSRDRELFGSAAEIERRYLGRCLPDQALYRERASPGSHAHIVVDNEETDGPRIERWTVPGVTSPRSVSGP
jgi:hypothetical protein